MVIGRALNDSIKPLPSLWRECTEHVSTFLIPINLGIPSHGLGSLVCVRVHADTYCRGYASACTSAILGVSCGWRGDASRRVWRNAPGDYRGGMLSAREIRKDVCGILLLVLVLV